jgi:hypothetical protein|tara:strand:+ start:739 stop:1032 length:294 start_codon:yes stop_codon:yes gene_type:complete
MAQTVSECLTAATDSVTVINDINSKGLSSTHISASDPSKGVTQADANARVKANVDHLTTILAYDGTNDTPNIKDASDDKSSYTTAINTGNTYISNNS